MPMTLTPGEPEAGPWRVAGIDELLRLVRETCGPTPGRPAVVAVDGRGASGKTTVAAQLAAAINDGADSADVTSAADAPHTAEHVTGAVVHTDDIAWNHSFFDWAALIAAGVLEPARGGQAVSYRPPAWGRHGRDGAVTVPAGCELVIVEGVGAGRRELAHLLDAVVWVQSDFAAAEHRGIVRDSAPGMGRDRAEATRFWQEWMSQELPFLAEQRPWERACAVVCGTPETNLAPHEVVMAPPDRITGR